MAKIDELRRSLEGVGFLMTVRATLKDTRRTFVQWPPLRETDAKELGPTRSAGLH